MHEYSLVQAMFDQIAASMRTHGALAVRRVRVRIGAQAGVEAALFRTAYDVFRVKTFCAEAPLDIVAVPASDELTLDRLELEVP
jgi:Zn finger protein HypA/HybF involved in hydrogenase expression